MRTQQLAGLVVIVAVVALMLLLAVARRWVARLLVMHATLKRDGLGRRLMLVVRTVVCAYPVRLTGVGGPTHRLDLSVIDERPGLDLGGVRAGDLAPLKDTDAFLVAHPVFLQLWVRSGLSYRLVAEYAREDLHEITFIEHDPDGLGISEAPFRGSVGTVEVFVTPELRLYLLVRIKPDPPALGPSAAQGF